MKIATTLTLIMQTRVSHNIITTTKKQPLRWLDMIKQTNHHIDQCISFLLLGTHFCLNKRGRSRCHDIKTAWRYALLPAHALIILIIFNDGKHRHAKTFMSPLCFNLINTSLNVNQCFSYYQIFFIFI